MDSFDAALLAMDDEQYVATARRAAEVSQRLSSLSSIPLPMAVRWILDATDDEILAGRNSTLDRIGAPRPRPAVETSEAGAAQPANGKYSALRAEVIAECLNNARGGLLGALQGFSNALEYLAEEPDDNAARKTQDMLGTVRLLLVAATSEAYAWSDYQKARQRDSGS